MFSNSTYLSYIQFFSLYLQALLSILIQDERRDPSCSHTVRSQIGGYPLLQYNDYSTISIHQALVDAIQLLVAPNRLSMPVNTSSGENAQDQSYLIFQYNTPLTLLSFNTNNGRTINRLVIALCTILSTYNLCHTIAIMVLLPQMHSIRTNQNFVWINKRQIIIDQED